MKKLNILSITAYDNSPAWKLDADGHVVLKDGNPVYLNASGQEMVVAHDTISRLNGEAKSHREAKEALETKLKAFEGIDVDKARKAIETVGKLDAKQLIESGKVDEVRQQITAQFTAQITDKDKAFNELQNKYDSMQINNVFAGSEFVRNNIAVPADMFEATFRNYFKVENGQISAYGKDGNRLLSKSKAGEYATPEEALQLLVDAHPQKNVILKADVGNGSGSNGGGGNRGGTRNIKRSEFDTLSPVKKAEVAALVGKGEMTLTD